MKKNPLLSIPFGSSSGLRVIAGTKFTVNNWDEEPAEVLEDLFNDVIEVNSSIESYMRLVCKYNYHIEVTGGQNGMYRIHVIED